MTLGNDNGTDGQTDRQTDRRTDRVRHNMRPPPREEGRIINKYSKFISTVLFLPRYRRVLQLRCIFINVYIHNSCFLTFSLLLISSLKSYRSVKSHRPSKQEGHATANRSRGSIRVVHNFGHCRSSSRSWNFFSQPLFDHHAKFVY